MIKLASILKEEGKKFTWYKSSAAADKAKKLGLTSSGWGYWTDKSGQVVAKSAEGGTKLVPIEAGPEANHRTRNIVSTLGELEAGKCTDEEAEKFIRMNNMGDDENTSGKFDHYAMPKVSKKRQKEMDRSQDEDNRNRALMGGGK